MPYICDKCGKEYMYRRNLTRHTNEKHRPREHWNCVREDCRSKFIRRSYLHRRLVLVLSISSDEARHMSLLAPRGGIWAYDQYYEGVSADELIFNLPKEEEAIADFRLDFLASMPDDVTQQNGVDVSDAESNGSSSDIVSKVV